jgi:molybdopterin-guanine dinucleotide biosynthesis protein A
MSTSIIDVVVLASGLNQIPLYEGYVPGYKALIPYHGRASIQYILDALTAVPRVGRICIEGPQAQLQPELAERLSADSRITLVEGGESFLDSLVIGLRHFQDAPAVLFIAADIPLVTPEAIQSFLTAWESTPTTYPQNLFLSAVPKSAYTGPYEHFTKPFNHYRDITLCHGNFFIAEPALLEQPGLKERIDRFYAGRKNSLTTTLALGWKIALAYLIEVEGLHLLTLEQFAHFVSKELGFGVTPLLVGYPEITIDVDEHDDYDFVKERIEERWRLKS